MMGWFLAESDPTAILRDLEAMKVWGSIIGGLVLIDRVMSMVDRFKGRPAKVEGTITTETKSRVATLADVQQLKEELNEFKAENETQHHAGRTAGEARVTALSQVMGAETKQIEHSIHELGAKVDGLTHALHEKVNRIATEVAGHGAQIPLILRAVERATAALDGTNSRIDDLVRMSAE